MDVISKSIERSFCSNYRFVMSNLVRPSVDILIINVCKFCVSGHIKEIACRQSDLRSTYPFCGILTLKGFNRQMYQVYMLDI